MMTDQNSTIRSLLRSGQVLEIGAQTHVRPKISSSSRGAGPRLILAFAAIYLIWGSTYLAIRFAVESIPPLLMMGVRHLVAGSLLYAWVRLRGTPAPRLGQWISAAIAGAPWCIGKSVLADCGSASTRLSDVFKSQEHWRRLIESDRRGRYRLRLPQR